MLTLISDVIRQYLYAAVAVVGFVLVSNSCRNRYKSQRRALLPASISSWQHLYSRGDSSSFVVMTGMDREAFGLLHDVIQI